MVTTLPSGNGIVVGDVVAGKRPVTLASGGSNFCAGHLQPAGALNIRNVTNTTVASGTEREVGFTYLLP